MAATEGARWAVALLVAVAGTGCDSDVTTATGGAGGTAGSGGSTASTGGAGGQGGTVPGCPAELPIGGANCDIAGPCTYEVDGPCGGLQSITATCVPVEQDISVWELDVPDCNGDPSSCSDYDHPTICAGDTSCRWLVQGCGEPSEPMLADGCYPNFDCTGGDCDAGQTCTMVTYDPCHTFCDGCIACGACGATAQLCL